MCLPILASVVAAKALLLADLNESLLAELLSIWWRHTSLKLPVNAQALSAMAACMPKLQIITNLSQCFSCHPDGSKWVL